MQLANSPDLLFVAVMKHSNQKQRGEEVVSFNPLTLSTTAHHGGSQGRNLEAGTEAGALEEHCLLACSHDLSSLLSSITQDNLHRNDTAHRGLNTPKLVINQENVPQFHGGNYSKVMPSWDTLCQIDKN